MQFAGVQALKARRNALAQNHDRPASVALDVEVIHQSFRADQANPHSGVGDIFSFKNFIQIGNALALVTDRDDEQVSPQGEFSFSTAAILEGVPGYLGDGGSDSGLVLKVEFEYGCEGSSFLPHQHDIILEANVQGEQIEDGQRVKPPPLLRPELLRHPFDDQSLYGARRRSYSGLYSKCRGIGSDPNGWPVHRSA